MGEVMDSKIVKDLMVPLDDYAVVSPESTLLEAIVALDQAQKSLPVGRQPHRAVLVADDKKKVVGKIGQLAFLKALEPKYNMLGDLSRLSRAGLSPTFISSMMENFQFFQENLNDLCRRAAYVKAKDVMHPVTESIEENASLHEAIHKIIMNQTLSLLVTRGDKMVGLLRLSDLFDEVAKQMKGLAS
jgi:CBS domain-containing protein